MNLELFDADVDAADTQRRRLLIAGIVVWSMDVAFQAVVVEGWLRLISHYTLRLLCTSCGFICW